MATPNQTSELSQAELMAMDLIDCGWEPGMIEEAFGEEPGWISEVMTKAAAEAQRGGLH